MANGNATTFQTTDALPELVDLIRKTFQTNRQFAERNATSLYIRDFIGKGKGNTKRYDEYDNETFAKNKAQGAPVGKGRFAIGYNKTVTKKRIGLEVDITQEVIDEGRSIEVGNAIRDINEVVPNRVDLDATHRLTFSSATAYTDQDGDSVDTTTGDGVSLVNASHTLAHSSTNYSNRVSGDPLISQGGLEAAETLFKTNILSNLGQKRTMRPNTIVTGEDPTTVNTVQQILASSADIDQNNSGVRNNYLNKYTHIVLPYLNSTADGSQDSTKAKWWFLARITGSTDGWQAYYSVWEEMSLISPSLGNNMVDAHADIWTWGVRKGYGFVATTPKGLVGSLPTS